MEVFYGNDYRFPHLPVPSQARSTRLMPTYRKTPWRLSRFQKLRQRRRLRAVDNVVATVESALLKTGVTVKSLERWKAEMPTEAEMLPKDKYTMFDRKEKRYRKGIHSMSIAKVERKKDKDSEKVTIANTSFVQNSRNGRGYRNESTLLDISFAATRVDLYCTIYRIGVWGGPVYETRRTIRRRYHQYVEATIQRPLYI